MGHPVYVLPGQDHIAHLRTHLAFLKSPVFGQNPAIVKTYLWPMAQHLRDHLLNYYLSQAHDAVDQAQRQHLINPDSESQVKVILQVQQEIEAQLAQFAQDLAQVDQLAQQFRPQPPMPPDSSLQVAQLNAQLQGQIAQQRAQLDQARLQQTAQTEQARLQQAAQLKQAELQDRDAQRQHDLQKTQLVQQAQDRRTGAELETRVEMNSADNATAMQLAAAEIASGDRVAVSTGTGINPNP
jgi:hypothetical protein